MASVLDLNAYGFSKHEETINSSRWRTKTLLIPVGPVRSNQLPLCVYGEPSLNGLFWLVTKPPKIPGPQLSPPPRKSHAEFLNLNGTQYTAKSKKVALVTVH